MSSPSRDRDPVLHRAVQTPTVPYQSPHTVQTTHPFGTAVDLSALREHIANYRDIRLSPGAETHCLHARLLACCHCCLAFDQAVVVVCHCTVSCDCCCHCLAGVVVVAQQPAQLPHNRVAKPRQKQPHTWSFLHLRSQPSPCLPRCNICKPHIPGCEINFQVLICLLRHLPLLACHWFSLLCSRQGERDWQLQWCSARGSHRLKCRFTFFTVSSGLAYNRILTAASCLADSQS